MPGLSAGGRAALLIGLVLMAGAARADEAVCKQVPLADIAPLLTAADGYDIRLQQEAPQPGEVICHWAAFRTGLAANAPADYALQAEHYRFDTPKHAAAQFGKDWQDALAPNLVRTLQSSDQVARDGDIVAVRHEADIVVLDPKRQAYTLQQQPDRFYRLESLAFRLAGATLDGVADLQGTQNPCSWLQTPHALDVLTTEPARIDRTIDGLRCRLSVHDLSPEPGHWTENHGSVQIERRDFGTHAAALKFEAQQHPFLKASPLVTTGDPEDRLFADPREPRQAWAIHGAFYAELNVTDATPAAQAAPGWRWRVERLALEAAGATVVPTADAVMPRPQPAPAPADKPARWTPPVHDAPALSVLYDPALVAVAFAARNRFIMIPILLVGMFLILPGKRKPQRRGGVILLCIVVAFGNLLFGTGIADRLLYHAGVAGSATITASHSTATQYNNQRVYAHSVLIRTADGQIVETAFEDDDFNVYPPQNRTSYPGDGDVFTVRYLKHAPDIFVIVADDDSPWAKGRRCRKLRQAVGDAASKADFAPDNAGYQDAKAQALAAAKQAGCEAE